MPESTCTEESIPRISSNSIKSTIESFVYKNEADSNLPHASQKETDIPSSEPSAVSQKLTRNSTKSREFFQTNLFSSTGNKRKIQASEQTSSTKKPRPDSKPSKGVENKLKDSLRPGLILIMVGVNPGTTTALTGHAYAHPSNHYWPTMFRSGVTPVQHLPRETQSLMDLYGLGHTNIIERTTPTEADIKAHEWPLGAAILEEKIQTLRPQGVAIVGKGIWKRWFEYKKGRKFKDSGSNKDHFEYGWQAENMRLGRTLDERGKVIWPGAETIVVATTSAAAAQFAANGGVQRIELWKPLGDWFKPKRDEWIKQRLLAESQNEQADSVPS